jgi:fibronectin type 3 domain-containing protein
MTITWGRPGRGAAPFIFSLLLAGCGYVGDPLPPRVNMPDRVQYLSVVERGTRILIQFNLPDKTTEGVTIKTALKPDVRIGAAAGPDWEPQSKPAMEVAVANGAAQFEIPAAEWIGKDVTVGVRVIGANGRVSDWSYASFPVVQPLAKPQSVEIHGAPEAIRLSWQGAEGEYRIYRRVGDAKSFSTAAEVNAREWVDRGVEYGTLYTYFVRRIQKVNDTRAAESEASNEAHLTPTDTFAPAVPQGVRADAAANSVELAWEADTESDIAGYRVYRATAGGEFEKIAEVGLVPAYSDRMVEHGKNYRYAISAFDKAGNESVRSAALETRVE